MGLRSPLRRAHEEEGVSTGAGTARWAPRCGPASNVWKPGETIHLGADRSLRVVDVRDQSDDEPTVLVVEDMAE